MPRQAYRNMKILNWRINTDSKGNVKIPGFAMGALTILLLPFCHHTSHINIHYPTCSRFLQAKDYNSHVLPTEPDLDSPVQLTTNHGQIQQPKDGCSGRTYIITPKRNACIPVRWEVPAYHVAKSSKYRLIIERVTFTTIGESVICIHKITILSVAML